MHRLIEITVPPHVTEKMKPELAANSRVIGLVVHNGASQKPKGDVLQVHVLNSGTDEVLRLVSHYCENISFTVVTSEVASITDPLNQRHINHDVDEAIWEEVETGIRHNGRLTSNFLMLMAIAGIITAVAFVADLQMQVILVISASIIAPGLEPITKVPLGIILEKGDILWDGVKTSIAGYGLLMLSAGLTFYVLLLAGSARSTRFLQDDVAAALTKLTIDDFISSLAASAAGIIMYLSYRRNVIAGPLIALVTIPAAASAAISIAIGEWKHAFLMLFRMGVDFVLIITVGMVFIWSKQKYVHRRKPLR